MNTIKKLFGENITFMMIPNHNNSIKQFRIKKIVVSTFAILLITSIIFLTGYSIVLTKNYSYIASQNRLYNNQLMAKEDTIVSLSKMTDNQRKEIDTLTDKLEVSADYFQEKVDEISALESELQNLIGLFNQRTDLNVEAPVSRSGDLTKKSEILTIPNNQDTTNGEDVISQQITDQVVKYSSLADDIENKLDFLDAKPDKTPVRGRLTSKFGNRRDPVTGGIAFHKGIDIANATGTRIVAAGAGVVTFSGWNSSYGRVVVVDHGYHYKTLYAHCSSLLANVGDHVKKGELIAKVGTTGKVTGPHVHFEIHYKGTQIDPLTVLD